MIQRYDYKGVCWWCNEIADSREHRYKKADISRLFGKGPFKSDDALSRCVGNTERKVQGPNSKELKFRANLCKKCNNERSQKFDFAYDQFIDYIHTNSLNIIKTRQLCFSSIFQSDWLWQRENIIKYFIKHICCRLAEAGVLIEPRVIFYLNGTERLSCVEMDFQIREDVVAMEAMLSINRIPNGSVWIGAGIADHHQATDTFSNFRSHVGYRWLRINYVYDVTLAGEFNNNPVDMLTLGSEYSIDPSTI